MKRALLRGGILTAATLAVMLMAIWIASYFIDPWAYYLTITHNSDLGGSGPFLHIMADDGYLLLFNQTWTESGKQVVTKYDATPIQPLNPVITHIAWDVPGLKLFYSRFTSGAAVFSYEFTLLVPILVLTVVAGILLRNRGNIKAAATNTQSADDGSSGEAS